jgi:nitrite reductase/ring-hydroxylating ferredoxin subunit
MKDKCCGGCSRRRFLVSSTKAVLGAALSAEILNSCNKLPTEIIGDDEQKIATIDLSLYTELKQVGGSAQISGIEENPLIAYRKSETEIVVVYSLCTHEGFLMYDLPDKDGIIVCPNDGAKFDLKEYGKALSPELTTLDLTRYYAILNGNTLDIYKR